MSISVQASLGTAQVDTSQWPGQKWYLQGLSGMTWQCHLYTANNNVQRGRLKLTVRGKKTVHMIWVVEVPEVHSGTFRGKGARWTCTLSFRGGHVVVMRSPDVQGTS